MTIRNIHDLAEYLRTTVPELPDHMREYTDYTTEISWNASSVTLRTVVPEGEEELQKTLAFPFSDDDFDDAESGLQCWADDIFCRNYYKED